MGLLRRLSISNKVLVLLSGLTLGFVVCGTVLYLIGVVERSAQARINNLAESVAVVEAARLRLSNDLEMTETDGDDPAIALEQSLMNTVALLNERLGSDRKMHTDDLQARVSAYEEQRQRYQQSIEAFHGSEINGGHLALLDQLAAAVIEKLKPGNLPASGFANMHAAFVTQPTPESWGRLRQIASELAEIVTVADDENSRLALDTALQRYLEYLQGIEPDVIQLDTIQGDLARALEQFRRQLDTFYSHLAEDVQQLRSETVQQERVGYWLLIAIIAGMVVVGLIGIYSMYKSIARPWAQLHGVMTLINQGNTKVRAKLSQGDELGGVARTINLLLNQLQDQTADCVAVGNSLQELNSILAAMAHGHYNVDLPELDRLTASTGAAIAALGASSAQMRLDIDESVSVIEDLAGALEGQQRDSARLLAEESKQVRGSLTALTATSRFLTETNRTVDSVGDSLNGLTRETQTMRGIVDESADSLFAVSEHALDVDRRAQRINVCTGDIPALISQINSLVEQSHCLALDAAARSLAGEAPGRLYTDIAEEMQRLVEMAREATANLAGMIDGIHADAAELTSKLRLSSPNVEQVRHRLLSVSQRLESMDENVRHSVNEVRSVSKNLLRQSTTVQKVRDSGSQVVQLVAQAESALTQQKSLTEQLRHRAAGLRVRNHNRLEPETLGALRPDEGRAIETV